MALVVWSDAAFQGERNKKTQAGYIVGITTEDQVSRDVVTGIHWLSWHSGRVKRVTQSTFMAEAMSAYEALSKASHLAAMWQEVVTGIKPHADGIAHASQPAIYAYTDAMSLYEHVRGNRMLCWDRRFGATMAGLKDIIRHDKVHFMHVRTHLMLADGLTKKMDVDLLLEAITTGTVRTDGATGFPSQRTA